MNAEPNGASDLAVGVVLPRDLRADALIDFARRAEALGLDELWVVEDLGFRGGVAQAGVVLASTSTIRVGLGILPASVRNVAFTAMEVATLAELFPGRLDVGLGHGMPDWVRQVGAGPVGSVRLLEEQISALRALLAGERVDVAGDHVRLDGVRLERPPDLPPPVLAGVRGPRSLAASGRVADGTVLAEPVTSAYLAVALERIAATRPHRVVAYDLAAVADDPDDARAAVRSGLSVVGDPAWAPHVEVLPFADELRALRAESPDDATFASRLPDAWIDELALVGRPETVRARVAALHDAGASCVVLAPTGRDPHRSLVALAAAL